jgi:S1/P1 Nuclease
MRISFNLVRINPFSVLNKKYIMRNTIILFVGLFIVQTNSFGWGHEGHRIVADIAQSHMNKNIIDSVNKYLGTMTFEQASNWMDDIRSNHSFDFMKPWHYINIEKGQTYNPGTEDKNCITELLRVMKELNNRSLLSYEQTSTDIKILFHLIGDIHQPLHVGYGTDRGGNSIEVEFINTKSNLHKVWDTEIIQNQSISTNVCINANSKLTNAEIEEIKKIDVIGWMNESRAFLDNVYDFKNGIIDNNYIDKNAVIIEKQLFNSGIRLAAVLNKIFSK